ncbi:hypothetical protein N7468_005875 [Penicillium chermesinum]|uniref:Cytochrome b-c1 complex subunit 10 n=1 Tax=Penicillium chermesinum TaxID=63820 RepID=A0A9W9P047_9EURO|nr:uncharacterized protein N7468_005875 [Penicillium chermesinum]KAJ5232919.1 hypothetical protein N7468_005875 [Penicillium chermesinum]KAJ6172570.1 hypothetical protein N7470_001637 [Penicillium chermesinum]
MVFAPTLRRAAAQAGTAFGPKIAIPPRVAGFDMKSAINAGTLAASFGVFAGTAALFMLGDVPRVRRDILQQLPFLDNYLDRTIPPEDNPF